MTNSERSAVGFSRPIIMTLYQSKLVGHQMSSFIQTLREHRSDASFLPL